MSADEFPLLDFFRTLHNAGLPLGIADYKLLLKAFRGGFGTENVESLERLCKAIWVRSDDEEHLFNYHFSQIKPELIRKQELARSVLRKSDKPEIKPEPISHESETLSGEEFTPPSEPISREETDPESMPPASVEPETDGTVPPVSSELMNIQDEAAAAQAMSAIQIDKGQDIEEIPYIRTSFILSGNYFPVTRRQMKQSWRYLRRFVREGKQEEPDMEATVNEIGRHGILLEPVMIPRRTNRAELTLLIDQDGSMVPFHDLSERLKETAIRGGRLRKTDIFYFHNVPGDWLYQDTALVEAEKTDDVFARLHPAYSNVLIISDAGAARGGFNPKRLEFTRFFLDKLKSYVSHIAWLNPMPRFRWLGTTAGEIEQEVAMSEMSRRGLDYAISALRRGL